jgi:bifunctional oligoribonuclease and PAP phosphatase NrnA
MHEIIANDHCTAKNGLKLAERLKSLAGQKVVVLGHVRPDGDCIGAQVALTRILCACGCDAVAVNSHSVPRNQKAFVGDTFFFLPADVKDLGERIAISVDCATKKRLGDDVLARVGSIKLNIDHHISNENFAEENYIYPSACATSEVLSCIALDHNLPIDTITAQALYVGIATDTGQFKFANTTRHSFEICCELMRLGADPAAAARELYENEPYGKILLLRAFLESLKFELGGRVCVGILGPDVWQKTGASKEDTEGLVDYARDIEGVEIGVILEYRKGSVKGSIRAMHEYMRVDRLAAKFGGGGHAAAAGFNIEMDGGQFYPILIDELKKLFEETDNILNKQSR